MIVDANIRSLTSQAHPYAVFRRALERGNATAALAAAGDLPHVALEDALALTLLLRDEPERYERAAVRWLTRLAREQPELTLAEAQAVLALLAALRGPRAPLAAQALAALLDRHGLIRTAQLAPGWQGRRVHTAARQFVVAAASKRPVVRYRNPHTTRHTFATAGLRRGGRLETVSTVMGHASIQTMYDLYAHLDTPDVLADIALTEGSTVKSFHTKPSVLQGLRRGPESNRCTRLCRPLPSHSATAPRLESYRGRLARAARRNARSGAFARP